MGVGEERGATPELTEMDKGTKWKRYQCKHGNIHLGKCEKDVLGAIKDVKFQKPHEQLANCISPHIMRFLQNISYVIKSFGICLSV